MDGPRQTARTAYGTLAALVGGLVLAMSVAHGAPGSPYGDIVGDLPPGMTGLEQFWFKADFLAWQLSGSDLPPLITASPGGTPLADAGVLGEPTTRVLAGGAQVSDRVRPGYALSLGYFLNPVSKTAISAEYLYVGRDSYSYSAGPSSSEFYARPYFNENPAVNEQSAQVINAPDSPGSVHVRNYEDFSSVGASVETSLWIVGDRCRQGEVELTLQGGYRFYHNDSLLLAETNLLGGPNSPLGIPAGISVDIADRFAARNQFHGGEIGVKGRFQRREFWLDGAALLAIGCNSRLAVIKGSETDVAANGAQAVFQGGLLTSPLTNIGVYRNRDAVAIPRFRIGAGCQLTDHLSVRGGYNVIIWENVLQAAATLPPGLRSDNRNIPAITGGGAAPMFPGMNGDTFVAHGIDLALQFDY